MLSANGGQTLSPGELADKFEGPLSTTNYHVTELHKGDLVELMRTHKVRGATAHFYRLASERGRQRQTPIAKRTTDLEPAT